MLLNQYHLKDLAAAPKLLDGFPRYHLELPPTTQSPEVVVRLRVMFTHTLVFLHVNGWS